MVRKFAMMVGVAAVVLVLLPGAARAAAPPVYDEILPNIVYPVPPHQFEELVCAPDCPYWVGVRPLPDPTLPSQEAMQGPSSPSSAGQRPALIGGAIAANKAIGPSNAGAFMITSTGAGQASPRARSEAIRVELKSVVGQLGL